MADVSTVLTVDTDDAFEKINELTVKAKELEKCLEHIRQLLKEIAI